MPFADPPGQGVPAPPPRIAARASSTSYPYGPLCEAICGLDVPTESGWMVSIRGDEADPCSGSQAVINTLTSAARVDALSGCSVLNGTPVSVEASLAQAQPGHALGSRATAGTA